MRVATWNVNSVKQRVPRLLPWLDQRQPDVVCLQETKLADDAFDELLGDELASRGYAFARHGEVQWNGVAILSPRGLSRLWRRYASQQYTSRAKELLAICRTAASSTGTGCFLSSSKKDWERLAFSTNRPPWALSSSMNMDVSGYAGLRGRFWSLLDLKGKATAGYPLGLVADGRHLLAANRYFKPPEPCMKGFPQLDLAVVGANCLCLEIEQDKPRARPVGNADGNWRASWRWPEARLDN